MANKKGPPVVVADVVEVIEPVKSNLTGKGRPKIPFEDDLIKSMLKAGASGPDVADHYGCTRQTLYEYVEKKYEMSFGEYQRQCKSGTRHLLRLTQLKIAMGYSDQKTEIEYVVDKKTNTKTEVKRKETTLHHPPNAAMLIFLGKNELGQSDMPETPGDGAGKFGSVPDYRMIGDDEDEEGNPQAALASGEENDEDGYEGRFRDDDDDLDDSDSE